MAFYILNLAASIIEHMCVIPNTGVHFQTLPTLKKF
jgi:hypothetical protein